MEIEGFKEVLQQAMQKVDGENDEEVKGMPFQMKSTKREQPDTNRSANELVFPQSDQDSNSERDNV